MKQVTLTVGTVDIQEHMTWGMQEEIRTVVLGGMRMSGITQENSKPDVEFNPAELAHANYKALELFVKKITLNDGKVLTYSKEWMDNLSIEDGDKLVAEINTIIQEAKKK